MNILLLGSGGREHALAWKMAASPLVDRLFCAPGNAGIAREAECVALDIAEHGAVIAFCKSNAIDFVVVGPEAPLVAGIVDDLEAAGIKTFGPTKAAARLEGSKGFTKDLCRANGIPTAAYERFSAAAPARDYLRRVGAPIVVKADGLAAGKGVVVAQTLAEAEAAIDMMFEGGLGAAGTEVVIEEFLVGEEASFFALCDGDTAIALASAQDHKRVGDGDTGPNTGGMGAYSPAPVMTPETTSRTMDEIVRPTLRAMKAMGSPYKGVLFAGLMVTKEGPKLIEYNARFGDPETQVLMLRLMSDLVPALLASRDGQLKNFDLRWYPDAALTVVMAANGYPGTYARGSAIEGLDAAAEVPGVEIFHAGTKVEAGKILANGGRVLNVSASGKTVGEAQTRAYQAIDRIKWPDGFCRRDIGWQAVKRENVVGDLMHPVLRLYEDSISGNAAAVHLPALARMIFVVHGEVTIEGKSLPDGGTWHGEGVASLTVGKDGVTLWRFELTAPDRSGDPLSGPGLRSQEKLSAVLETIPQGELLLRGDSVAFPPGGCAFLHKHWGPGIRCLIEGGIRIDTHGRSTSYGPGSAWYETGSDPVFAEAAADRPSRFIRVMVLPRALLGKSSFQFVNEEDKAKPRVQQYKIFTDIPIAAPKA